MNQRFVLFRALIAALALSWTSCLLGEEILTFKLVAKDGRFQPENIEVPAGQRFRLEITNQNPGPEEFESRELRKELVLAPGVTRVVVFAPLKAGTYPFFGEFHPQTAKGRIIAK
jgi:cupredoxin-like protein